MDTIRTDGPDQVLDEGPCRTALGGSNVTYSDDNIEQAVSLSVGGNSGYQADSCGCHNSAGVP